MRVSAMLTICIGIFAFMPFLFTAASDVYAPVSGKVTEVNKTLVSKPELINDDCYGSGWICKIEMSNLDDVKQLMSAEQYEQFLTSLES